MTDADTILPWDGVRRDRKEINGPLPLREAFHRSALPHYQALVARLGPGTMATFLGRVSYGNAQSDDTLEFWLRGPLAISPWSRWRSRGPQPERPRSGFRGPAEALGVDGKNPVGGRAWRGKTGWSRPAGGPDVGWFVGALDVPEGRCFVALRLEAEHPQAATFLPQRGSPRQGGDRAHPWLRWLGDDSKPRGRRGPRELLFLPYDDPKQPCGRSGEQRV